MDEFNSWFDNLYKKYVTSLLKTASAILGDQSIAEEIVHDVFVILLIKQETVQTYESPGAWLFRTLHNKIENELRRAKYSKEIPYEDIHEMATAKNDDYFKLEDVLPAGLSDEERKILIWYYEEDLQHEEIAQRLNISIHASHARLYRAKKKCFILLSE